MVSKNQERKPNFPRCRLALAASLAMVLLGAVMAPGWAQSEAAERQIIASADPCLSLHSEPDSKSPPVRCLAPGRRMNLLESREGWARVRLADAQEGWVLFRLVRPALDGQRAGVPGFAEPMDDRQIAMLESALAAAAVQRAELQRGTSALRTEIYELQLANERIMTSAFERAEKEATADRRLAELETALADAEARSQVASDESLRLEQKIATLEADARAGDGRLEELTVRLEAAEKLSAEAEADRLNAVQELGLLRREEEAVRERAEAEREEYEQVAAALRSEIDQLDSVNERLASEAAVLAASQSETGAQVEALEAALTLVEADRSELEQEAAGLRSELEELRATNERLAMEAAERADTLPEPESATGSHLEFFEVLGSIEAERLELEQANSELRSEVDRLRDANEWLAVAAVERPLSVTVGPIVGREYEGAAESNGSGGPAGEIAAPSAEAQGEVARTGASKLASRIAVLENELVAEKSQVEDLSARLDVAATFLAQSEAERIENGKELEALRREIEGLRDRVTPTSPPAPPIETSNVEPAEPVAPAESAAYPDARESTAMVDSWAKAWSEQRVEDVLSFYSNSFEPPGELSRGDWEAQRRERISEPERIDVRVALADLRTLAEDRVEVVFLQSYESDRMTDVVLKTLELVREDGGWKIAAERVE